MSNYDLGTATGTIELKYKDSGGPAKATKGIKDVEKSSVSAGQAMDKVGSGAGIAGLAIAGGLGLAIKSASTFEKGLSAIKAVSGSTADEMEKVRAKALQIGKDTSFGATDAAQAMEELAKAGVSTGDILNGAADATVALAAAGEIDLPKAAEIASNAMNQFGLAAKDLPNVADKIAGAANASAIDVKEFGYSLSQVGAVANLAGLSFDDTTVAIAELGNAGIKGSDAGTSLKTMLSNLQPTTLRATHALEDMGIITKDGTNLFYDQTGKLKSLRDIQELLNKGTSKYTAAQKQAAFQTIFGSDAIRAAAVLSGQGAKGYDKLNAAIGKTKAADVAKTRMDNLAGSVEQLKGSAETLGIQLGTVLLPTIRNIVNGANDLLGKFLSLSPEMQKVVVYTAAGAAGFLLMASALIKIVKFGQEFAATVKVLSSLRLVAPILTAVRTGLLAVTGAVRAFTVALLTNPIFLIIAALVLLAVALVVLYKKSETFRNIVNAVWAAIKSAVLTVVDYITGTVVPAIVGAWNAIGSALSTLWGTITSIFNAIVTFITTIITAIYTQITTVLTAILGVWKAVWGIFGPLVKAYLELVKLVVELVLLAIFVLITNILDLILKGWTAAWNTTVAIIKAVWDFIGPYVTSAASAMKNAVIATFNALKSVMGTIWNTIKTITSAAWGLIKTYVVNPVKSAYSAVVGVLGSIKTAVSNAWGYVKSNTSAAWKTFYSYVKGPIDKAMALVRGIRSRVVGALAGAGGWLKDAGRRIIQGLLDGINSMIGQVRGQLNNLTNLIPDWKGPASKDKVLLKKNGELIIQGLIKAINSQVNPLRRALQLITKKIPTFTTDMNVDAIYSVQQAARARQATVANAAQSAAAAARKAATTPAPARAAQAAANAAAKTVVNVSNYNPVAEPSSVATARLMTRLAQMGVLG